MVKPIEVIFLKQAEDFANSIEYGPRKKLFQAIRKTRERMKREYFEEKKNNRLTKIT